MENAIKKSIEGGGWKQPSPYYRSIDRVVELAYMYDKVAILVDEDGFKHRIHTAEITENPLFWQALGKAEGWPEKDEPYLCPECKTIGIGTWNHMNICKTRNRKFYWKVYWHLFIDHLAEGKDAESFFNELLK